MSFSLSPYFKILDKLFDQPGCPWSKLQSFSSIAKHVIEETYEALDAYNQKDPEHLKEELGDLLFTISFLVYIAKTEHKLSFEEITQAGSDKIIRRSDHVFKNPREMTLEELRDQWQACKAKERASKKQDPTSSIAKTLPLLDRAAKWAELAHRYQYQETFEENHADQILKSVFQLANQHENPVDILEQRLSKLESNFKRWVGANNEKVSGHEKTGDDLTT